MQPNVNIDVQVDQAHREIAVAGELDVATRSSVIDATDQLNAIEDGDINLDLDDVTFIDAAGVGTVVAVDTEQSRRHTTLQVRSSSHAVRRVFALCRLEWMLTAWTRQAMSRTAAEDDRESPGSGPQAVLRAHIAQLELALQSSRRISAAVGIVMATRGLSYDAAFELLILESQSSNRKLRDVAEAVLGAGGVPARPPTH